MKRNKLLIFFSIVFLVLTMGKTFAQNLNEKNINSDLNQARSLIENNKYDEAKIKLDRVIKECKKDERYNQLSKANYLKGDVFLAKGNASGAYEYYNNAFTIAQINKNVENQFESLYRIGFLFYRYGKLHTLVAPYVKAIDYFELCQQLDYANRTHKYQIIFNEQLANSYYIVGRYKEAEIYFLELYKYSRQQAFIDKQIIALRGVAESNRKMVEYQVAIDYELQLFRIYKKINKPVEAISVYIRIAKDYRKLNLDKKSIEYCNLLLNSEAITPRLKLEALENLSIIELYKISPDYKYVQSKLSDALEIAVQLNDLEKRLLLMNQLALSYLWEADLKNAESTINEAIEISLNDCSVETKIMIYTTAIEIAKKRELDAEVIEYQKELISLFKQKSNEHDQNALIEYETSLEIEKFEVVVKQSSFVKHYVELDRKRMEEQEKSHQLELEAKRKEAEGKIAKKEIQKELLKKKLENEELEKEVEIAKKEVFKAKILAQNDSITKLKNQKKILQERNRIAKLKQQRNRLFLFVEVAIIGLAVLIGFFIIVYRTNKKLKTKNIIIAREHQIAEDALHKLKETQDQLLESERLASLGQLTAGIAHEIRNPLNFVTNFSSLNIELSAELEEEINKIENHEHAENVLELAAMISGNSKRVKEHGARASRIVNQMLESTRKGGVRFEETDIQLLLEESSKLAYQGVRGKYLDFMADLIFNFDENLRMVEIVGNDLSRVIINLITNSCHATLEKHRADSSYKPKVLVTTIDKDDSFVIQVEDNGKGMNEEVKSKIFDPFFTTKPAGKGTGLGLTMTFEIITKVHNGSITVESEEGQFTRFTMTLPKKKIEA